MIDLSALFGSRLRTYADRESWLADRAGDRAVPHRLGGSDVAAILADDAFGSPWSLYAERVLGQPQPRTPQDLEDLARGHALEPAVRRLYEIATGRAVTDMTGTRLGDLPEGIGPAIVLRTVPDAVVGAVGTDRLVAK